MDGHIRVIGLEASSSYCLLCSGDLLLARASDLFALVTYLGIWILPYDRDSVFFAYSLGILLTGLLIYKELLILP